jgi:hypothetical protein
VRKKNPALRTVQTPIFDIEVRRKGDKSYSEEWFQTQVPGVAYVVRKHNGRTVFKGNVTY